MASLLKMRRVTLQCCLLLTSWVSPGCASGSVDEVIRFLSDNGHHFVDIFHDLSSMQRYSSFKPKDIFFSRNSIEMAERKTNYQFSVFMYDTKMDNLKDLVGIIGRTNVKESLLILDDPTYNMSDLQGLLELMNLNAFFYLATPDGEKMSWYHVISLVSGCVIETVRFFPETLSISERFNLNGLEVTSTSLSWEAIQ